MPPGSTNISCPFDLLHSDFENRFFNPSFIDGDFETTYYLEDSLTLSWYGGLPPDDGVGSPYQTYGLYLQDYNVRDAALITNITITGML